MSDDAQQRPGESFEEWAARLRDELDWEPLPEPDPDAAERTELERDDAYRRACAMWTEQERRAKLHAGFEMEGRAVREMNEHGVGDPTTVSASAMDAGGYLLGFTPAEVRAERFEWQEQRRENAA